MSSVTYSKSYRVNMGNYEHIEFSASVTLDDCVAIGAALRTAEGHVEDILLADIKSAHEDTDIQDSFIHLHPSLKGKKK